MIMYKTESSHLRRIILHDGKYIIPRKDGHILCGSTLEWKGFRKTTTIASKAMLRDFAVTQVPFLADLVPIKHWSGLRPGSPNGVPYIGEHQRIKGLYLNTGHYRYGVTMGLGSAELLRDIMLQRSSFVAAAPYALDAVRKPTDEFAMHS
jgi:glycine oxidase